MESLSSSETSLSVYHSTLHIKPDNLDSQISDVFFTTILCNTVWAVGSFFLFAFQPNAGYAFTLIHVVSRSHTTTHHRRYGSSGRVISSLQRPLPENTRHLQEIDIHVPRRYSNPQSQQASGRRPMP
jgi:hypothetical protein